MLPSWLSPVLLFASAVTLVSARHLPIVEARAINSTVSSGNSTSALNATSILDTISTRQRDLFSYSMQAMDTGYDSTTQAFL
jgi:hypothetical protein